jgi:hypothetical protein
MTNEHLQKLGRLIKIDDKAVWLVKDKVALVCRPHKGNKYYPCRYAVLFHEGVRVGVVFFMGDVDIHWLIFPEHRGKGYLSEFVHSGIIKLVEPELKTTLIPLKFWDRAEASHHLAEVAGLKVFHSEQERHQDDYQQYCELQNRYRSPCHCGSGKQYRLCCRDEDEEKKVAEEHPCPQCYAFKSHTTATRCWRCGANYDTDL